MSVYFDNASTSWPKPPGVLKDISAYLNHYGGSPGRSGHSFSLKTAREIFEARELLAEFLGVPASDKVIFTHNATHAINIALKGLLKKHTHVITTHAEHNSVIRPLRFLEDNGYISLSIVPCNTNAGLDLQQLEKYFKPETGLLVSIHGSNVNGYISPVNSIGKLCKEKGVPFMVDAAQTAGFTPIDMQKDNINLLVFSGHKKMLGVTGTGGLCINGDFEIKTLIHGGTGSMSEEERHPHFYPDTLEAGTPNTLGVIALKAGLNYIRETGINSIREKLMHLSKSFTEKLKGIEELDIFESTAHNDFLPIISINIKNISSSMVATVLDKKYGIMCRAGLHCAPLAHKSMGTFPKGTLRFSLGYFNNDDEINTTINALKEIIYNENN